MYINSPSTNYVRTKGLFIQQLPLLFPHWDGEKPRKILMHATVKSMPKVSFWKATNFLSQNTNMNNSFWPGCPEYLSIFTWKLSRCSVITWPQEMPWKAILFGKMIFSTKSLCMKELPIMMMWCYSFHFHFLLFLHDFFLFNLSHSK